MSSNADKKAPAISREELEQAILNTTLASAFLDGAMGAHDAHPHILQAADEFMDASANLVALLLAAAGYTRNEAFAAMDKVEAAANVVTDNLAAAGRTH